jgi:hypothetical protein
MSEQEIEAANALKALVWSVAKANIKSSADLANFQKEFEGVIAEVFKPKGGSENFSNLRSPGQPSPKIVASPGESGKGPERRTVGTSEQSVEDMTREAYDPSGGRPGQGYQPTAGKERYGDISSSGSGSDRANSQTTSVSTPAARVMGGGLPTNQVGGTPGRSGNYGEASRGASQSSPVTVKPPFSKSRYSATEYMASGVPMPDGTIPGTEATLYQYQEKSSDIVKASLFPDTKDNPDLIDTKKGIAQVRPYFSKNENATALIKSMTRVAREGTGDQGHLATERIRKGLLMGEKISEDDFEEIGRQTGTSLAKERASRDMLLPQIKEEGDEVVRLEDAAKSADRDAIRFEGISKDVTVEFIDRLRAAEYAKSYRKTAMDLRRKARSSRGVRMADII